MRTTQQLQTACIPGSTRARAANSASARSLCVLFIGLYGFKSVNDQLGHAAGAALLKVVGSRLAHELRGDDFVCRCRW